MASNKWGGTIGRLKFDKDSGGGGNPKGKFGIPTGLNPLDDLCGMSSMLEFPKSFAEDINFYINLYNFLQMLLNILSYNY